MTLLGKAGRVVTGRAARGTALGFTLAMAASAGALSALGDPEGTWRQGAFPEAQQLAFGNPRMVQESMYGGIQAAFGSANTDVVRPGEYYYGSPVNLRRNDSLGIPVSGEMIFGMHKLRRG